MTTTNKTAKKFSGACNTCSHEDVKQAVKTTPTRSYSFYSNVLNKPFASVEELEKAEAVYFDEQKAKEDAAAKKKTDAKVVEDAFKALNAARKVYKEDLTQLTKEYAESLENLKKAFELGKKDIHNKLAEAEETYQTALKEFTDRYDSYHITLKDGDFETTLSKQTSDNVPAKKPVDLFDLFFGW
jgi:dsDNA-specific endonuclease/ATPase MutS2